MQVRNGEVPAGCPVRIYRNTQNGLWSVQMKVNGVWKVVRHVAEFLLRNVQFHVNQGGWERCRQSGQRNVHAFACGQWEGGGVVEVGEGNREVPAGWKRVWYVPFLQGCFMAADREIRAAQQVVGDRAGIWVKEEG